MSLFDILRSCCWNQNLNINTGILCIIWVIKQGVKMLRYMLWNSSLFLNAWENIIEQFVGKDVMIKPSKVSRQYVMNYSQI